MPPQGNLPDKDGKLGYKGPGYKGAIDPHPYWTGIHAEDYGPAITLYQRVLAALKAMKEELTKPR